MRKREPFGWRPASARRAAWRGPGLGFRLVGRGYSGLGAVGEGCKSQGWAGFCGMRQRVRRGLRLGVTAGKPSDGPIFRGRRLTRRHDAWAQPRIGESPIKTPATKTFEPVGPSRRRLARWRGSTNHWSDGEVRAVRQNFAGLRRQERMDERRTRYLTGLAG
jgi:hypothetical protein